MTATIDRSQCTGTRHTGTATAYDRYGCRCPDAREASRIYRLELRLSRGNRRPSRYSGTARRVQAVWAMGYSPSRIAGELGWDVDQVLHVAHAEHVDADTAEVVDGLFRRWAYTPGPDNGARKHAVRDGFVTAMAWEDIDTDDYPNTGANKALQPDELVVRAVLAGRRRDFTVRAVDRDEVIRRVLARGDDPDVAVTLLGSTRARVDDVIATMDRKGTLAVAA